MTTPSTVASVLDVRERTGRPLIESITVYLERRHLLLVLDNCEHLVEACAQITNAILQACPAIRILTTSREPLHITGEVVWRVPSLTIPPPSPSPSLPDLSQIPSVQLFAQRAQDVQSTFAVTKENAATVAAICVRLDGLPLAIELAAGWVRSLGVGEILSRLDNTLQLLVGGSRTGPTRQQTMRATLDWSHALLTIQEQVLLRRLSVFAGDWDLDATLAICADPEVASEDVLRLLTRLVDASLVQMNERHGNARYHMLEPIRAFAKYHLATSSEAEATGGAHAAYFLALSQQISLARERHIADLATLNSRYDRMEQDHDNFRAALN